MFPLLLTQCRVLHVAAVNLHHVVLHRTPSLSAHCHVTLVFSTATAFAAEPRDWLPPRRGFCLHPCLLLLFILFVNHLDHHGSSIFMAPSLPGWPVGCRALCSCASASLCSRPLTPGDWSSPAHCGASFAWWKVHMWDRTISMVVHRAYWITAYKQEKLAPP